MKNSNSFKKGFKQIKNGDIRTVRQKLMEALSIKASSTWYSRLYGKVIPNKVEIEKIEKIFAKYGITDIWG